MLTYKGVKQVGIPALLLFNLPINDLVAILTKLEYQLPNLPSKPTALLLYAHDAATNSTSPHWFKESLKNQLILSHRQQFHY